MPAPLRIINNRPVELDEDRIVCRSTVSPAVAGGAGILGIIGLLIAALVPFGPNRAALMLVFVLSPACGLIFTSFFLFMFDRKTVIDVARKQVTVQERMMRLPMNTHRKGLDEFEQMAVSIQTPGRESKPGNYATVIMKGPEEEIALFDTEDFSEARKTARALAAELGLAVTSW